MPLPDPRPGLVIRYDFLWSGDAHAGQDQGKDRPACIVVASPESAKPRFVVLLPITHTAPTDGTIGVEIPLNVKRSIGLDDEPSWIVVSESNVDIWPNAGISTIPGRKDTFSYGFLPPGLFKIVKAKFLEIARNNKGAITRR